jgi:endonuclease/exonuclease/phosphatase family metal-dependent hydrolase
MPRLKIVTINLLVDLSRWSQRRLLLAQGLADLAPDLVALQEVQLPHNPAGWLADQLGYSHVYLSPKLGPAAGREALAVISRAPFENTDVLDLGGQGRIAQRLGLNIEGSLIYLVNGHFFWQPGESPARLRQVERLLDWLHGLPGQPPCIVCGDFNGTPQTQAIQRMRQGYRSAYAAIHGDEPEYTCPTPLRRSAWSVARTFLGFFLLIRPRHLKLGWRGTLDYIFVDPRLGVSDCRVVLDQPAPGDPRLYPSDHFGLYAEIEIPHAG